MKKEYSGIIFAIKTLQNDAILSSVEKLDNDISLSDWIDE